MERIWLKQYPAGVPADIDVTHYASLVELLEESFAKFSDRKAFICMDKSISYRDLDEMSQALAAYLQSKGLQRGARVARCVRAAPARRGLGARVARCVRAAPARRGLTRRCRRGRAGCP